MRGWRNAWSTDQLSKTQITLNSQAKDLVQNKIPSIVCDFNFNLLLDHIDPIKWPQSQKNLHLTSVSSKEKYANPVSAE